jgi:formylglycine-generating enzyme required for sulfatase activity/streptogramin lyase
VRSRPAVAVVLAAAAPLVASCRERKTEPLLPAAAVEIRIRQFKLPTADARPQGIAAGPDGAVWFTEARADRIGRIGAAPSFSIEEFPLPHAGSEPWGIVAGADGNVWFTESSGDRVGRISPRPPHEIFEVLVPASRSWPRAIAAGPDGNLWFAEAGGTRIGRVRVAPPHEVEEFPLPRFPKSPATLAAGPDGNIWFAGAGEVVGRALAVYPEAMIEFPLRVKNGNPSAITAGSDGNIWFAQERTGTIGRILVADPHTVTELGIPGAVRAAAALCATPGYIWLVQRQQPAILRIEVPPPHRIREISIPETAGTPEAIAAGPDGNIWFTVPQRNSIGQLLVRSLGRRGDTMRKDDAPATLIAEYRPAPPPVVSGELDIRAAEACTVSVDGVEMFRMARDSGRAIPIAAGRHVVSAVAAGSDARWQKPVEVFSGMRAAVIVEFSMPSPATAFALSDPRIEFLPIRPGEFVMGSDVGHPDERPAHRVRLTRAFEMGRYEVTQAEWAAVMGPIELDTSGGQWFAKRPRIRYMDMGEKKPVVGVSWEDAQDFLSKLNALDSRRVYRLPTEAEWEYACRAGTIVDLPADIAERAWIKDNFGLEFHPVGKKNPNEWGLYDMQGNASEWVADWYDKDYYRRTPPADPTGPPTGYTRIFRGGDAWNPASNSRCAYRQGGGRLPVERGTSLGFRVVRQER